MAATTPSKDLEDITLNRSNFTVVIVIVFPARNGSFFEAPHHKHRVPSGLVKN